MRDKINSSKIVWSQSGLEELKRLLNESDDDDQDEESLLSPGLDYPWEPTVVLQESVVGDGGDIVVNVKLGFDDIDGAEDYEVRVALLPDIVDLNPVLGPNWQVPGDARPSPPLTYYSGWHTAVKMNASTALILWLVDSGTDFGDTEPTLLKGRTVSLDNNMSLGTPFVITSLAEPAGPEAENLRAFTLSDGRIIVVVHRTPTTPDSTEIILLSASGSLLNSYVMADESFWMPAGEIFNDKLFMFDANSDAMFSFDFTGNTVNIYDSTSSTTGLTTARPTLLVNSTHVFLLDQDGSGARYWSIEHTDGLFAYATWAGPTSIGSPLFYAWEEDSYMRAMKTGTNEWIYHGTTPDGASEAWAIATFTASGSTLSIGGIRKFDSPDGVLGSGVFGTGHTWTIESGTGFYMGPIATNWLFMTADGKVGSLNEITGPGGDLTSVQIFDLPLTSTSPIYRQEWSMMTSNSETITGLTRSYKELGGVPIPGPDGVLIIQNWAYDFDTPTEAYLGNMVWVPLE
jgi:hypothetical protein